jgi:hypothetical protein
MGNNGFSASNKSPDFRNVCILPSNLSILIAGDYQMAATGFDSVKVF